VAKNGFLKIVNNRLSNERGEAIQLKGVSTHGLQWKGSQYSKDTPRWLRDDWKADLIRIAMYTDEGGYLTNRSVKGKLEEIVQGALDAGIYVIIDWHILKDANPKWHTGEAVEFFREMSSKYGKYANVLYEICNEPNPEKGPVSWMGDIKPYADTVIPEIRHNDPNNIILVGTPMWSSDIKAPLEGKLSYNNVMYSLHKYTGEHDVWNTNYIVETIDQGVPVFVTEWGPTMADGGSSNWNLDRGRADTWVSFLARNKISWAAWSLSEDPQLSAMLKNGPGPSHWRDDQLSESGHYIREKIREGR
jgi:endoglucanase